MSRSKIISQFNEGFIKDYREESNERYFLEAEWQYLGKLNDLHNDLPFIPERKKIEKVEKIVANLHDETEYAIHIRSSKQTLNHGLVLKVHRVIKSNQNAWVISCIGINTDLRAKQKMILKKIF